MSPCPLRAHLLARDIVYGPGGPGTEAISRLIRSLPREKDRGVVAEKFYRAFVFKVIAGCTDAHAKNCSPLLKGRSADLAPLDDPLTSAAYRDG